MAISLKLVRTYSNRSVTRGELMETTTGFRCRTLERREPSTTQSQQKCRFALPCGTYRMKLGMDNLRYNLWVSMTGAFRNARFISLPNPNRAESGCISLGTQWEDDKMKGGDLAADQLHQLIEYLIINGRMSAKGKVGEVVLTIEKSKDFIFDDQEEEDEKLLKKLNIKWDICDDGFDC